MAQQMTGRLRVGINLLFLGQRAGGVGRLALELVRELGARDDVQLELFVGGGLPAEARELCEDAGARLTRVPGGGRQGAIGAAAEYGLLPLAAVTRRVDMLHSLGNAGPVSVPGMACVVSIHDLIWRRAGADWGDAQARAAMDRAVGRAARDADLVITGSHDAADGLTSEFSIDPDRIAVVHNGVRPPAAAHGDSGEVRNRLELGTGPILLCVAQKRPYKNHEAVIRALAALGDESATLVLPGAPTEHEAVLKATAAQLGVATQVRFLDWISDADLDDLYRVATAFILPSKIEGFGLPVLEAMVRGLPVICSQTTALGEVAGDAALLVDPDDQQAINQAVRDLVGDAGARDALIVRGHARAAEFSWARTADETVAAYRRAIASRA